MTYYRSILAFAFGTFLTISFLGKRNTQELSTLSDRYCTKVAASQFSMWVEVRAKLLKADNPLSRLNDSDRKLVNSNPKLKSLSETVAKFQEVIMSTPIVNRQTDLEFRRIFGKLNELIADPEKNKSEIEQMKSAFASTLKENAPEFMAACHSHVAAVTKNCQENFEIGSEKFTDCADPKLREKAELALELVPGYKVITAANSSLKEMMSQVVGAL